MAVACAWPSCIVPLPAALIAQSLLKVDSPHRDSGEKGVDPEEHCSVRRLQLIT